MDFNISEKGQDYLNRVKQFMKDEIFPIEEQYHKELASLDNRWVVLPIIAGWAMWSLSQIARTAARS